MNRPAHHPETAALLAGRSADDGLAPALEPSTAFEAADAADAARRAVRPRVTDFYGRYGNPTVQAFADAVAELEGAEAAICSSSGMGAISTVVLGMCSQGSHVVTQRQLFSGTLQLFNQVCPRFGIDVTFVDVDQTEAWLAAVEPGRTTLVFVETPSNPTLGLADLDALGAIAGPITVVDSTMATPLIQRPLDYGVDLVVHSATKALSGHNDATLGVIAGEKTLVNELWGYAVVQGSSASAFDSWNALRGLKTLGVRIERQCANALQVASILSAHSAVAEVFYPGLDRHPQRELAARQMASGGGCVTFEFVGGYEAACTFVDALHLAYLAPSLGGPETLVNHPASMTHAQLAPAERAAIGIGEGMIRMSMGLEHPDDVTADICSALQAAHTCS